MYIKKKIKVGNCSRNFVFAFLYGQLNKSVLHVHPSVLILKIAFQKYNGLIA